MNRVAANGIHLNVLDRGHGAPILFVHGFPLNHTMWHAQLDALSDQFRVIAPDLRGFGHSSVMQGTVSMELFADDLNGLIDALGVNETVTLCGLSMGGYIALAFARKFGHRLRSLILCDTRAVGDSPEAMAGRKKLAAGVLEHGPELVATAMLPKLFAVETTDRRPEVVAAVRSMVTSSHPHGIAAALQGMAQRPDSSELLSQIEVPVLLIVGREDKISTVDEMRTMSQAIKRSEFVEIPAAGHMAPMENPESVNAAMRKFLSTRTW